MALHEYFGLDTDILWDLVANKVPDLKRKLDTMLGERPNIQRLGMDTGEKWQL